MTVALSINGETRAFAVDDRTPLIDVLRDHCRLTGAKSVCREGFCGACSVIIDGEAVPSCLRPVGLLVGSEIVTIEGVAPFDAALPGYSLHWCFFMSTQPLSRKATPSSVSSARWSGKFGARRPAWLTTRWQG